MNATTDVQYAAFVGIDWADRQHDVCLPPAGGDTRALSGVAHRPERLRQWAKGLRQRFRGRLIAVCLALTKGPLVSAWPRYEFLVLFPGNPTMLAKYRATFCWSHANDDPTDAELALARLLTHPDKLRARQPHSAAMRTWPQLVEQRRGWVADQVRLTNRLTHARKPYVPQMLEWFKDKDPPLFCDFLPRWPTLKHAQRARNTRLMAVFQAHHGRYPHVIEPRVQAILTATPLTADHGVLVPNRLRVEVLVQPWRAVLHALERFDAEIAPLASTRPAYPLFRAWPGAGPTLAPRLLAAFGEQRERSGSAAELQRDAGMAPVTERRGNQGWGHWRWQCPTFRRHTFVEWAAQSIPHGYWAAVDDQQQRTKGVAHQAALRALAFTWIRSLYRCWQDRTPSDEATYRNALQRRGSPLLTWFRNLKFTLDRPPQGVG